MKSIFNSQCPWCSHPVNVLKDLFLKKSLGQCKSCKKYHEIDNFISSFSISVMVTWIYTFSKFVRLRKYEY